MHAQHVKSVQNLTRKWHHKLQAKWNPSCSLFLPAGENCRHCLYLHTSRGRFFALSPGRRSAGGQAVTVKLVKFFSSIFKYHWLQPMVFLSTAPSPLTATTRGRTTPAAVMGAACVRALPPAQKWACRTWPARPGIRRSAHPREASVCHRCLHYSEQVQFQISVLHVLVLLDSFRWIVVTVQYR
jgi:hypothetical protein